MTQSTGHNTVFQLTFIIDFVVNRISVCKETMTNEFVLFEHPTKTDPNQKDRRPWNFDVGIDVVIVISFAGIDLEIENAFDEIDEMIENVFAETDVEIEIVFHGQSHRFQPYRKRIARVHLVFHQSQFL